MNLAYVPKRFSAASQALHSKPSAESGLLEAFRRQLCIFIADFRVEDDASGQPRLNNRRSPDAHEVTGTALDGMLQPESTTEASGDHEEQLGKRLANRRGKIEEKGLARRGAGGYLDSSVVGDRDHHLGIFVGSATNFKKIDTRVGDFRQLRQAVRQFTGALVIDRVDLDADTERGRDRSANRANHLDHDACTLLRRAAVLVRPLVAPGGQELGQQVAVRGVDLDAGEARVLGDGSGGGEAAHDVVNLKVGHGAGRAEDEGARGLGDEAGAEVDADGAGRDGLGADAAGAGADGGLAARVVDLDEGGRAALAGGVGPARPGLDVVPPAEALVDGHVLARALVRRVHLHVARQQQAPVALGPQPVRVDEVRVREHVAARPALGQCRLDEPVGQGQAAGQGQGGGDFEVLLGHCESELRGRWASWPVGKVVEGRCSYGRAVTRQLQLGPSRN